MHATYSHIHAHAQLYVFMFIAGYILSIFHTHTLAGDAEIETLQSKYAGEMRTQEVETSLSLSLQMAKYIWNPDSQTHTKHTYSTASRLLRLLCVSSTFINKIDGHAIHLHFYGQQWNTGHITFSSSGQRCLSMDLCLSVYVTVSMCACVLESVYMRVLWVQWLLCMTQTVVLWQSPSIPVVSVQRGKAQENEMERNRKIQKEVEVSVLRLMKQG